MPDGVTLRETLHPVLLEQHMSLAPLTVVFAPAPGWLGPREYAGDGDRRTEHQRTRSCHQKVLETTPHIYPNWHSLL